MSASTLPIAGGRETWQELRRASGGHRLMLCGVFVLGLLSATLGLAFPAMLGHLVDLIEKESAERVEVVTITSAAIGAAVASAIGTALTVVLAARTFQTILADLRERLVAKAMMLPQGVVERAGSGDLIARASDDIAQVSSIAAQVIPALTTAGFTIIVTLGGMTVLDWRYALALTVVFPVYVVTLRWYLSTAPSIYRAERAAVGERAQHILESLGGRDTVLGFGIAEPRHHKVIDASWAVVAHSLRARTVQNMFFGRLNFAEYLGMAGILVAGYLLIGAGHSTVGAATTAMLFFLRLFGPINQLLFVVDVLQSALASLGRIVGVITMAEAKSGVSDRSKPLETAQTVRLRDISFAYDPGHPVLHNIDLTIAAGERVAIVGASGTGKTTLAGVVAGIHTPENGTVTRPTHTAVITQEAHVFTGTLRDNLTLAAPGASDDEVSAALAAIGASALIAPLPDGLDTQVGAAGHELTTTQAQQIALARLLLADPELAILDEATAEAGSTHAGLLDRAAEAALHGRTGLVIAHRLSQAAACDRIVVMEHGRIVESGSHTDLLAAGGTYARLWDAWETGQRAGVTG
ncbi:MAG: ABC transporter ATP-binding protein/permease [Nocardioidaceae bacterium]|nr:ABC transporter ATP-binding protein/permease [Nocardioidaceae bacterium]